MPEIGSTSSKCAGLSPRAIAVIAQKRGCAVLRLLLCLARASPWVHSPGASWTLWLVLHRSCWAKELINQDEISE